MAPVPDTMRLAGPTDSDQLAELWLRSRKAAVPSIPAPVHDDDDVRGYFGRVVVPTMEVWVVERQGAIVALLALSERWIEHLYVEPGLTGQGLGTRLLGRARERRPGGLDLWTFQSNAGARRFYERHGFVAVGMTEGDNEEGAPDVRYEWRP